MEDVLAEMGEATGERATRACLHGARLESEGYRRPWEKESPARFHRTDPFDDLPNMLSA